MDTRPPPVSNSSQILSRAPLARVLLQVRWPELAAFDMAAASTSLRAALGTKYPVFAREAELQVTFGPNGPSQSESGFVDRFSTAMDDWRVSLGRNFIAVETSEYNGHEDFLEKSREVLMALDGTGQIPAISRIGYRYTNRLVGKDDLQSLRDWFDASVLGGIGQVSEENELVHSLTESVYRFDSFFMLVRSARIAPNESIDPSIPPVSDSSWVLDIDSYEESRAQFDVDRILERAAVLSKAGSGQFRSAATEEFLEARK